MNESLTRSFLSKKRVGSVCWCVELLTLLACGSHHMMMMILRLDGHVQCWTVVFHVCKRRYLTTWDCIEQRRYNCSCFTIVRTIGQLYDFQLSHPYFVHLPPELSKGKTSSPSCVLKWRFVFVRRFENTSIRSVILRVNSSEEHCPGTCDFCQPLSYRWPSFLPFKIYSDQQ